MHSLDYILAANVAVPTTIAPQAQQIPSPDSVGPVTRAAMLELELRDPATGDVSMRGKTALRRLRSLLPF